MTVLNLGMDGRFCPFVLGPVVLAWGGVAWVAQVAWGRQQVFSGRPGLENGRDAKAIKSAIGAATEAKVPVSMLRKHDLNMLSDNSNHQVQSFACVLLP